MKTSFNRETETYNLEIDIKELTLMQSAFSFTYKKLKNFISNRSLIESMNIEKYMDMWDDLDFLLSEYQNSINKKEE